LRRAQEGLLLAREKEVEAGPEQGMGPSLKELQQRMMEQGKMIDNIVRQRPYTCMGVVFLAGLTFGALMGLKAGRKY